MNGDWMPSEAALEIPCLHCGAAPYQQCRTDSGHETSRLHLARWEPLAKAYGQGYQDGFTSGIAEQRRREVLEYAGEVTQSEPIKRPRGGSDEFSEYIASVYRSAHRQRQPVAEAVRKACQLTDTRQADRYIAEARQRGYLPTVKKGTK